MHEERPGILGALVPLLFASLFLYGLTIAAGVGNKTSWVSIDVSPATFFPGATVVVTCRVPRNERNRWLAAGIQNYTLSERQLDGASAPITHRFEFQHVPCDAPAAYCAVKDDTGAEHDVFQNLVIAGCEP